MKQLLNQVKNGWVVYLLGNYYLHHSILESR
jgi:hypothetical protein